MGKRPRQGKKCLPEDPLCSGASLDSPTSPSASPHRQHPPCPASLAPLLSANATPSPANAAIAPQHPVTNQALPTREPGAQQVDSEEPEGRPQAIKHPEEEAHPRAVARDGHQVGAVGVLQACAPGGREGGSGGGWRGEGRRARAGPTQACKAALRLDRGGRTLRIALVKGAAPRQVALYCFGCLAADADIVDWLLMAACPPGSAAQHICSRAQCAWRLPAVMVCMYSDGRWPMGTSLVASLVLQVGATAGAAKVL